MNLSVKAIEQQIYTTRGYQVMLDHELATLYETETKLLNKAVSRNIKRFPQDFSFQLLQEEYDSLRFQFGTLNNIRGNYTKYLPHAFTEQGIAMLSSILRSDRAIEVNIAIMRTFAKLRQQATTRLDLEQKLNQLEQKQDTQFNILFNAIQELKTVITLPSASVQNLPNTEQKALTLSSALLLSSKDQPIKIPNKTEHALLIDAIQRLVAKYFEVLVQDLKASTRIRSAVLPRHIAIYLIRKHTHLSFQEIGNHFGGRDHTTAMSAYNKIAMAIEKNQWMRETIQKLQDLRNIPFVNARKTTLNLHSHNP